MDGPLDTDAAEIVSGIQQARLEPGSERAVDGARTDSSGIPFDPRIHTGTRSPKGRWRRRKNASLELIEGGATAEPAPEPAPKSATDFETLANLTVVSLTSALSAVFGGHWKAEPAEMEPMRDAWAAYYRARGVSDLPPEGMLALAMAGYVLPRLAHPQTRSWFGRVFDALRATWRRLFRRRGELAVARPGDRADRHGQDETAAGDRQAVQESRYRSAGLVSDPPRI